MAKKPKSKVRTRGEAAGGRKVAQSGGAYIPSETVTVKPAKKVKLKPMDVRVGGVIKRATTKKVSRKRG